MRSLLIPVVLWLAYFSSLVAAQTNKTCALSCGNGTCAFDKLNQSFCQCRPDFFGKQCELTLCDASSFQMQCKNNGRCFMNDKRDKFQCVCDENHQFEGALCEKSVCADYCLHDNRCEVKFDFIDGRKIARPSCQCSDTRYTGDRCEFDRCLEAERTCPKNCSLTTSSCKCDCGTTCDASYCNGNGVCVEKNDQLGCKCKPGYSGDTCFVDDCKGYCFFNGTCQRSEESGVTCECINGSTEKRCAMLPNSKSESSSSSSDKPLKGKFQIIRVVIYGITIILLLCLFAICAYVFVQRGYADRLFRKNQPRAEPSRANPRTSTTTTTERVRNFLPSFRFFKSSNTFNRLDDEQPITHYENAHV